MSKSGLLFILISGLFFLTSCKTEFEKIRTSGDSDLMYKKAFEYYEAEEWLKAQTLFEQVLGSLRGKVESEQVYFNYANTHYKLKKYLLASYYFKNFSTTFGNSDLKEEAEFMSAYSNYRISPTHRLDQDATMKAIDGFQLFVNNYPESEKVEECNGLIDELRRKLEKKAFAEGELYYNLTQYQSAKHSFENLLKEFPESPDIEKVRFMIVKSSYLLAENSIYSKKKERYEEAVKAYELFVEKFPKSAYKKELKDILNKSQSRIKEL